MANATREYCLGLTSDSATKELLALLSTGKNPDGTDYTFPVNVGDLTVDAEQINLNTDQVEAKLDSLIAALAVMSIVDVGSKNVDAQAIAATPGLKLVGWSATENAGAAAQFTLRHGTSVSGSRLVPQINLAASESSSDQIPGKGAACANGIFLDMISGSIDLLCYGS